MGVTREIFAIFIVLLRGLLELKYLFYLSFIGILLSD